MWQTETLDPNNWGTDDDGNYIYDIYADIEYWESEYETAPEAQNWRKADQWLELRILLLTDRL